MLQAQKFDNKYQMVYIVNLLPVPKQLCVCYIVQLESKYLVPAHGVLSSIV